MKCWLVTTDHLTDRIWFKDEEDFRAGMNLVAVLTFTLSVEMLAFTLMSNHVHFVMECSYEKARLFADGFKKRYSQYIFNKDGTRELLRRNRVDIQAIDVMDESLERAIAYVQMNGVAANICLSPTEYPWGTGNAFFRVKAARSYSIGTLSRRASRALLHSTVRLPSTFLVGEDGYILPESYVNVERVEKLFKTARRMQFFLQNSSKAKRKLEASDNAPSFRDQLVQAAVQDLCRTLFRKQKLEDLSQEEQTELLKQLRYRFSAEANQLARATGLSYETVAHLLDKG